MERTAARLPKALRRLLASVVFWPAVLLLLPASPARACSCLPAPPPCEAYRQTPAVFIATVTGITTEVVKDDPASANPPYEVSHAHLAVGQVFKGVAEKEIRMWQGTGSGDCSFVFEKGETYLLYAAYDEETKLFHTNTCSRSRALTYAADDLDYLRGLPASDGATRLSGTLVRLDYAEGAGQPPALLGGIRVVAEDRQGRRFEAATDAHGFYKITGLPAGHYKVRPELPNHLSLAYGGRGEVEVAAGGCAGADFLTRTDGRISGVLLDAEDRPVADAYVDLVNADLADRVNDRTIGRYRKTDKDGRFEFTDLTPGSYLLGVNIRQEPSGDQPFPRTYYPGVSSAAQAQAVKLDMGEKLSGFSLRLPPRLPARAIEGVLVWPDGTPVTKALVTFKDTPERTGGEVLGMANVDAQGRFSIPALEGQEGWVHSAVLVPVKDGLAAVAAEPLKVVAGAGQRPVRLVAGKKTGGGVKILP